MDTFQIRNWKKRKLSEPKRKQFKCVRILLLNYCLQVFCRCLTCLFFLNINAKIITLLLSELIAVIRRLQHNST